MVFILSTLVLAVRLSAVLALPVPPNLKLRQDDEDVDPNKPSADFGQTLDVSGNGVTTEVLFPGSNNGVLRVEFADAKKNTLTVTENKSPASAPAGFIPVETSSFIVALGLNAPTATVQAIDYIFDSEGTAAQNGDIANGKIGKFSVQLGEFVIDDSIGEIQFASGDNELRLLANDLEGEYGIFIPVIDGIDSVTEGPDDPIIFTVEKDVAGKFDEAVAIDGDNLKTDIAYTANAAGALQVEVTGADTNSVTVTQNTQPKGQLPVGFVLLDPTTFIIKAEEVPQAGDVLKVDYIFADAVKAAQGRIAKLDAASNTFVIEDAFELVEEEDALKATVTDLNGEFAAVIPA